MGLFFICTKTEVQKCKIVDYELVGIFFFFTFGQIQAKISLLILLSAAEITNHFADCLFSSVEQFVIADCHFWLLLCTYWKMWVGQSKCWALRVQPQKSFNRIDVISCILVPFNSWFDIDYTHMRKNMSAFSDFIWRKSHLITFEDIKKLNVQIWFDD